MHIDALAAEVAAHVDLVGWDQLPRLFAFASTAELAAAEPSIAEQLGIGGTDAVSDGALTLIEQEELPDGDVDVMLAQIAWPAAIVGCALSHEIVFLPPEAESGLDDDELAGVVTTHPQRREARLTVAVLRNGLTTSLLRIRPGVGTVTEDGEVPADELLVGQDLAPNLVSALLATFE